VESLRLFTGTVHGTLSNVWRASDSSLAHCMAHGATSAKPPTPVRLTTLVGSSTAHVHFSSGIVNTGMNDLGELPGDMSNVKVTPTCTAFLGAKSRAYVLKVLKSPIKVKYMYYLLLRANKIKSKILYCSKQVINTITLLFCIMSTMQCTGQYGLCIVRFAKKWLNLANSDVPFLLATPSQDIQ